MNIYSFSSILRFGSKIFGVGVSVSKRKWVLRKKKKQTSQTIMASWLVPFLPCWVNRDATSVKPLAKSLPGIRWSERSPKEEFLEPYRLLELFLLRWCLAGEVGEPGMGLLLSEDKQDPIRSALTMLRMHSRPTARLKPRRPPVSEYRSVRNPLSVPPVSGNSGRNVWTQGISIPHHNHDNQGQILLGIGESGNWVEVRKKVEMGSRFAWKRG